MNDGHGSSPTENGHVDLTGWGDGKAAQLTEVAQCCRPWLQSCSEILRKAVEHCMRTLTKSQGERQAGVGRCAEPTYLALLFSDLANMFVSFDFVGLLSCFDCT